MTIEKVNQKQILAFRKYFSTIPHAKDLTLVVLKGHLLLEEQIRETVIERLTNKEAINKARFNCHQLICLAEALCPDDAPKKMWLAAKKLNKIRNDLAHHLEPKGVSDRIEDFIATFPSNFENDDNSLQEKFENSLLILIIMMSAYTDRQVIELL